MRIAVAGGASLVALALLAYALRGPLIAAVTAPLLSLLTGYHVRYDSLAVGHGVIAATGVTVDRGSEPILSAPRIDATYALRDIFPGGSHRFGFLSVALERPHVTLVHHADGSYNLPFAPASSGPGAEGPARAAGAPLYFTARIRGGTLDVIDRTRADPSARDLRVTGIALMRRSRPTSARTTSCTRRTRTAGGRIRSPSPARSICRTSLRSIISPRPCCRCAGRSITRATRPRCGSTRATRARSTRVISRCTCAPVRRPRIT